MWAEPAAQSADCAAVDHAAVGHAEVDVVAVHHDATNRDATDHDAVVIGAGPAGATAAIRLAQAGWSVAIIEKKAFPRRKVCGECIAASNLPLLDALGVGEAFDALAGAPLRRVALMWGEHAIEAPLPVQAHPTRPWGRALGRDVLDALLLDRARELGVSVLQPATVKGVEPADAAGLRRVRVESGWGVVALRTRVVIAAHGSWERWGVAQHPQATRLQQAPAHRPGDLFAFKANFVQASLAPHLLPVLAFAGGYGGMVLGDRGRLTLACCIRRDRLAALRGAAPGRSAAEAVEAYLQASCAGVRATLAGARRDGAWLAVGPLRPGIRMPLGGGEAFLVGNAAGEAHPIIGEGMSMAMQSAWLLADHLLRHDDALRAGQADAARAAVEQVARDYAEQWRRAFAGRIRLAAVCAHLAMRPAMGGALLAPLLRGWPGALTKAAHLAGKTRPIATT